MCSEGVALSIGYGIDTLSVKRAHRGKTSDVVKRMLTFPVYNSTYNGFAQMAALTYTYITRYILYSIWHPNWHFGHIPYSTAFQRYKAKSGFQQKSFRVKICFCIALGLIRARAHD